MMDFSGKVIVITGGASDIGKAISRQLKNEACTICLLDINKKGMEQFSKEVKNCTAKIVTYEADMTNEIIVEEQFNIIKNSFGKIDFLFNIVGYALVGEARDMTVEHWKNIVNVNLFGMLYPTIIGYKLMVQQKSGSIMNMSSIGGVVSSPFNTGYAATKAAIIGLSAALREEAKEFGVNVSVVCAGGINTKLWTNVRLLNIPSEGFLKLVPPSTLASPEKAAKIMLRGAVKKKRILFFPASARISNFVYKFIPGLYNLGVDMMTVKSLRSLRNETLREKERNSG